MIKQIAWDTFKKTGDIQVFLELKQIENFENNVNSINKEEYTKINNKDITNVKYKGNRNYTFRK